jgi:uncharacterized membrane protein YgcG
MPRLLTVALALFVKRYAPQRSLSGELPRLSGMVNDFTSSLKADAKELEVRLRRFNGRSGYAIVIVIIRSGEDEQISILRSMWTWKISPNVFETHALQR